VLAGGFINDIGDWLLLVALPVFIFTKTGSGASTAALFVVELAVTVALGPFVGRLVDRWDLRRTLICTNVAQAVALLPLVAVTADRLWPAYVVAVAQSGLARINNPATMAIVPQLVARPQLVAANAASASASSLARLVGSPLGGIVVETAGLGGVIVADGISFLVVASATWFVRADTSVASRRAIDQRCVAPDTTTVQTSDIAELPAVYPADAVVPAAIVDHDDLAGAAMTARGRRSMFVPACLSGVAQGMFLVLFLSFVVDDLRGEGSEIGAIRGVQAVGGVLGSIVIARLASRLDPVRLYSFGLAGMCIVSAVIWNGPTVTRALAVYVVLFIVVGVPAVATNVGARSLAQRAVPRAHLGRFAGQLEAVNAAGTAVGSLVVGGLLGRVERWTLFDAQCAMYAMAAASAMAIGRHTVPRVAMSSPKA
jgi:MFS family permease